MYFSLLNPVLRSVAVVSEHLNQSLLEAPHHFFSFVDAPKQQNDPLYYEVFAERWRSRWRTQS